MQIRSTRTRLIPVCLLAAIAGSGLLPACPAEAGWPPLFRGTEAYVGSPGIRAVAVGELDGDDLPDLVTAGAGPGSSGVVTVRLHSGDSNVTPLFQPWELSYGTGLGSQGVVLADMNRDGNLDVVVSNQSYVSVLLGTGSGNLQPPAFYFGDCDENIAVADLNNDSWPDVVAGASIWDGSSIDGIVVLLGTGNGALGPASAYPAGSPSSSSQHGGIEVGDVTGDGALDVVAAGFTAGVVLFRGDNTGAFTVAGTLAFPSEVSDVAIGRLNADAIPDLAVVSTNLNSVLILLGTGGGTFSPYVSYPVAPTGPVAVALGDMDGDGALDIVAAGGPGFLTCPLAVLRGTGGGTFDPPRFYPLGPAAGEVVLADVDLSGRLDVVAPASVYPFVAEPIHMVHVLLDDGAGGFLSSSWSLESRQLFREALADFNRDGAMDLVYATEPLAFRIALGGGDGTFLDAGAVGQPGTPGEVVTTDFNQDGRSDFAAQRGADILGYFGNGTGSIPPLAFTITANRLYRRSAVDMNRDGRPDLVTRGSGTRILNVVAQLPDGTFQTSTVVSSGGIQSLATGDWNRDGKPDVAVAMSSGVSLFPGTGTGTLNTEVTVATGKSYADLCAGDFNRDGRLDVAALDSLAATSQRGIDVFLGNGLGGFGPAVVIPTLERTGVRIDTWDANGDGRLDLISSGTTNFRSDGDLRQACVEVNLGDGQGSFSLRSAYALGSTTGPSLTHAYFNSGDVNRDDRPDIVSPNVNQAYMGLQALLGIPSAQGSGLLPNTDYATLPGSSRVALGDLNRDGALDVVTGAGWVSPGVAVRLGNGLGVLGASTTVTQSQGVSQIELADMNRDGLLDLVTASADVSTPDMVSCMLGVGDGTFGPRLDHAISAASSIAVADMNRDGILDIVAGQATLMQVCVLIGNGDGTFTTLVAATSPFLGDLEAVDVNRDGILDVACVGADLYVLYGNGNGTLTNATTFSLAPAVAMHSMCSGDINRDGYPDIAAAGLSSAGEPLIVVAWGWPEPSFVSHPTFPMSGQRAELHLGTAEGNGRPFLYMLDPQTSRVEIFDLSTFTSAGSYAVDVAPGGLALGDLDRDGLPDVVTVNSLNSNISVLLHGPNTVTGVAAIPGAPRPARLDQNYPNPFNPSTTVRYATHETGTVRLAVYDVQGRLVATLVDGRVPAGEHTIRWDGRTDHGTRAATGVYYYRLSTSSGDQVSRRMVMLR